MSETHSILCDARPETCYVLLGTTRVIADYTLEPDSDIVSVIGDTIQAGGGTDFIPFFEWIKERYIKLDVAVLLTDTFGRFPDDAPPYDVVVCSTVEAEKARPPSWKHKFIEVEFGAE